jgi:hypothetical protein
MVNFLIENNYQNPNLLQPSTQFFRVTSRVVEEDVNVVEGVVDVVVVGLTVVKIIFVRGLIGFGVVIVITIGLTVLVVNSGMGGGSGIPSGGGKQGTQGPSVVVVVVVDVVVLLVVDDGLGVVVLVV